MSDWEAKPEEERSVGGAKLGLALITGGRRAERGPGLQLPPGIGQLLRWARRAGRPARPLPPPGSWRQGAAPRCWRVESTQREPAF
jgi:hypothetical protein